MSRRLIIEADGGSRGNPGPAAYGAVVRDADTAEVLAEVGQPIGRATNNVAEYRGLLAGLELVRAIDPTARVEARLDSKLVVEQMSGRWKIKDATLRGIALQARDVLPAGSVTYTWVPRAQNKEADRLVNSALDGTPVDTTPIVTVPAGEAASGEAASTSAPDAVPADAEPGPADAHEDALFAAPGPGAGHAPAPTSEPAWAPPAEEAVTRLVLVRHGRTPMTVARQFSGGSLPGPGLDEVGQWQARQVGASLARLDAAAVIASPMVRTQQTAAAIAERLGRPVRTDDGWRELDFGSWEGRTFHEIEREHRPRRWGHDLDLQPANGESLDALADRITAAADALLEKFSGQTVVVVTHSMPVRVMATLAAGAPTSAVFRLRPLPASVAEIEVQAGGSMTLTAFGAAPWAMLSD